MNRSELQPNEIGNYYWRYINLLPEKADLIDTLISNTHDFVGFLNELPKDKWHYSYEDGKWNILEMLQHIIDTERVFQYRALSFARGEEKPLPGFDHDRFAEMSDAGRRLPKDLISEFQANRDSAIYLFKSFNQEMLKRTGNMNGVPASPRAIGFIMAGHVLHHIDLITKKYL
ncbi:MAG: DinB family protein [Christiangramia sp.]|uniref:DinB family protein n=1 Tax=Christiangramia sp. TaxID=1931228 RepID=UPI0032429BE2